MLWCGLGSRSCLGFEGACSGHRKRRQIRLLDLAAGFDVSGSHGRSSFGKSDQFEYSTSLECCCIFC
jgi:hypothetical protein